MGENIYVPLFIPDLMHAVNMKTYYRIHCNTSCSRHLDGSYKHGPFALVERAERAGWAHDSEWNFYCPQHRHLADSGEPEPTLWDEQGETEGMYVPKRRHV